MKVEKGVINKGDVIKKCVETVEKQVLIAFFHMNAMLKDWLIRSSSRPLSSVLSAQMTGDTLVAQNNAAILRFNIL